MLIIIIIIITIKIAVLNCLFSLVKVKAKFKEGFISCKNDYKN